VVIPAAARATRRACEDGGVRTRLGLAAVLLVALGTACGSAGSAATLDDVDARVGDISAHVEAWSKAATVEEATAEAEAAANLVLGPDGPGYGDSNRDGRVSGANQVGLLPGPAGGQEGLVVGALGADPGCVRDDVLGGPWDDPDARWRQLSEAITRWTPDNNTFPTLASHAMRIVGWAAVSQSADLDAIHEYAGHARLHVDVIEESLAGCRAG
jgi:hypothetical protein